MTIQESIDGKKWVELHAILGNSAKSGVADNKAEYENGREVRESQVGGRADKITKTGQVSVNKIPVAFQRKIVQTASSFILGAPVSLTLGSESTEEDNFKTFLDQWVDLRLDSMLLTAAEKCKSETESAILMRAVRDGVTEEGDVQDTKLKATVLSSKNGKLLPGFNEFNEMVVFGYEFESTNSEGDKQQNLYLYFRENLVRIIIDGDTYTEVDALPHFFKKIPVVYFGQDVPEWEYVKGLIDRYEMTLSKFADTNDYFAAPFFKATGNVDFVLEKDSSGEVYKLDVFETDHGNIIKSDLDVVSWEHAPESVKLEVELVKGLIYDLTDTPDLSFDNVKGLGNISGVALELMFLAPIIKARFSEGLYRTGVSRLINVLKAGMVNGLAELSPAFLLEPIGIRFNSILPKNVQEIIEMLTNATAGGKVMSQQTAVSQNPWVKDAAREMELIKEEDMISMGDPTNI